MFILTGYQGKLPGRPTGFEVQVNNSYVRDPVKTGSLYHVKDVNEPAAKDNEWFTEQIIVKGDTITISVNDKQTVHWQQPADWGGTRDFAGREISPGNDRAPGARSEQHRLLQEHPDQAAGLTRRAPGRRTNADAAVATARATKNTLVAV